MGKKKETRKPADSLTDAVAEIVHQGCGHLLDGGDLRMTLEGWEQNCCANCEYHFAWNPDLDIEAIDVNWKRPSRRILRRVIKGATRLEKVLNGSPLTKKEQEAYRLELARQKYGYQAARERLDSGVDVQWVDLSFVTDSKGRQVFVIEMADAPTNDDESWDSLVERLGEIWSWKSQPLTIVGPFASEEEAEAWMAANGAFDDIDDL